MSAVTLVFSHSRTETGIDVAAVIRSVWPDAAVSTGFDSAGRVASYVITLNLPDEECAIHAARCAHQLCAEMGFESGGPDG